MARTASDLVAYGAAEAHLDRLLAVDARLRRIEDRSAWVRGLASGAQVVASGVAVIGALMIGGDAVLRGELAGHHAGGAGAHAAGPARRC